jgi:hypothetical protein
MTSTTRKARDLEAWRRAPMPVNPFPERTEDERRLEWAASENPREPGEEGLAYVKRLRTIAGLENPE